MKVLIEITDDEYKGIVQNNPKNFIPIDYCEIIRNGTPLNGTNGDVIKAVYPNTTVTYVNEHCGAYTVKGLDGCTVFTKDWWNAPYKTESEDV